MRKLGVAVIGVGFWGRNHARVFREMKDAELVAVCDVNPERVNAVAEHYGVKGYRRSLDLLKREDVEAVTICTWSTNLAKEAMKALKAGKHVFVEKPMAHNLQYAKKLVNLAEKEELHLAVGFIERFNPGVQHVKETIEKEEIGVPVSAVARRVSQWPERIGDIGVVKDVAIHDIDVVRYIFGEEPMAVYAKLGRLKHGKFEDYAQIMLTFEDEKTAFIESNWLTPYKVRSLIVTGSEGIIRLENITQEVIIETSKYTLKPRYRWMEPLKIELQHFVNCVLGREKPLVTGLDGLKNLQIAEAALKSAKKCKTMKLK